MLRLSLASGAVLPALDALISALTRVLAAAGGTLTYANTQQPTSNYWDPVAGFGLVDEQVASLVHDTVLTFDASGTLNSSLATAWSRLSPTAMDATLRTDAKFHGGSSVTAEDIKASFDRLCHGKLAQAIVVSGISVTIKSPTTIEIVLPQPFGVIENARGFVKILRKADIDSPDNFKKGAVGSGPCRFILYKNNDVTPEANSTYWGGRRRRRASCSATSRITKHTSTRCSAARLTSSRAFLRKKSNA